MANGNDQDKEISIGITFKRVTLDLQPQQFATLVEEAAGAMRQRVIALFETQRASKAVVGIMDPLESKGVEVSVKVTF